MRFRLDLFFLRVLKLQLEYRLEKKNFKLAVDRNRIKRQMRESAKKIFVPLLNESTNNYNLMLVYNGKEKPVWKQMVNKIKLIAEKFKERVI